MRIPCRLQLTLRCTIPGLCPELLLFFLEAPLPRPRLLAFSQHDLLTEPHFVVRKALRGGQWGCGSEALQGALVPRAALRPSLGEEAGRPGAQARRMSSHLS